MSRIAALDYGHARIGLAICDERKVLATALPHLINDKNIFQTLLRELAKWGTFEALLIGLPLHLNGKESEMSLAARQFAEKLEAHLSLPIIFWDERLSSAQAERALKEASYSRKKRSTLVDSVSAALLLQSYLDSL